MVSLCVIVFFLGIFIDLSLSNIYSALNNIARELKELNRNLKNQERR